MDILDVFGETGLMAQAFENYKPRPQQILMSRGIAKAFADNKHIVVEGPTGVGKGFGYLVPLAVAGLPAIVSTSNKSLQDQLNSKDLPVLKKIFPDITWSVLKGRSNYFCAEKFEANADEIRNELLRSDFKYEFSDADIVIEAIKKWAETDPVGDIEYLPVDVPPKVRELITCDNLTTHEPDSWGDTECRATQARRRAQNSIIVLVNHTLLALDLAVRRESDGFAKVLPDKTIVVLDEAHEFENSASRALSDEITMGSLYHLLNKAVVKQSLPDEKRHAIANALKSVLTAYTPEYDGMYYKQLKVPLFKGLDTVAVLLDTVVEHLETVNAAGPVMEGKIKSAIKEAKKLQDRMRGMSSPEESQLRWSEAKDDKKGEPMVKLCSVPLNIAPLIRAELFDKRLTVSTSATLAVNGEFDYYQSRVGMPEESYALVVPSPFDFKTQCLTYITTGAEPKEREVEQLLAMSKGRAFILFTSYKDMKYAYDAIRTPYPKIKQGQDGMTRNQVLEWFMQNDNAILFATKTFWEGVDIQGEKLSLVVIWKTPFENPSDLIFSAKCERIDKEHGKGASFMQYAIPDACIKLKQGVGRLIRSVTDKGVVAFMDERINKANYKGHIINALPPSFRTQQLEKVQAFFERINENE